MIILTKYSFRVFSLIFIAVVKEFISGIVRLKTASTEKRVPLKGKTKN